MSDDVLGIIAIAVTFVVGVVVGHSGTNVLESTKPITPELRITIKYNQIDTVYIYRTP